MRAALVAAARDAFARDGYAATSTPALARAAGATRGALYHHFDGKAGLMRAVLEAEAAEVGVAIRSASSTGGDVEAQILAGLDAYFDAMSVPGRTRLLLVEGPAALGAKIAARIDAGEAGAELRAGLAAARPDAPAEETAALSDALSAAFDRAALAVADGAARGPWAAAMRRLVRGALAT